MGQYIKTHLAVGFVAGSVFAIVSAEARAGSMVVMEQLLEVMIAPVVSR